MDLGSFVNIKYKQDWTREREREREEARREEEEDRSGFLWLINSREEDLSLEERREKEKKRRKGKENKGKEEWVSLSVVCMKKKGRKKKEKKVRTLEKARRKEKKMRKKLDPPCPNPCTPLFNPPHKTWTWANRAHFSRVTGWIFQTRRDRQGAGRLGKKMDIQPALTCAHPYWCDTYISIQRNFLGKTNIKIINLQLW